MNDVRPLRVLVGMPFGSRAGGAENVLLTLMRHRELAGIEPHVWFRSDGPFREEVADLGVETSVASGSVPSAARTVARRVRASRPDVLLSWLPRAHVVMSPAAIATGATRRAVCWQHIVPTNNMRHWAAFALPCAGVIATSEAAAAAQRRLWPRRPVRCVSPGVEDPVRISGADRASLRAGLGVDDGLPVLGVVGRLVGWKGQERLVEALALMARDGVEARLVIVGGEDARESDGTERRLRERAAALGLEHRVTLTGQVPDALPYIQALDVLVNASDGEPFGLTLVEAMALEVPVVAVAKAGPLEIVEDGRSGILIPTADPAALARGLATLLHDPDRLGALAEAGRRRYESRFTPERMAADAGAALRAIVS